MEISVLIITLSDRAYNGIYEDKSGPLIEAILREEGKYKIKREIIPDSKEDLLLLLTKNYKNFHWIITTGGTGISPRDFTPEVCQEFCDKELPGIAELLRMRSLEETIFAAFSRGYCGIKEETIVVNFPGSTKAVTLCTKVISPLIEHGIKMLKGEKH